MAIKPVKACSMPRASCAVCAIAPLNARHEKADNYFIKGENTMNNLNLSPLEGGASCPFPFFDDTQKTYKIYNDGRHYIATECIRTGRRRKPADLAPAKADALTSAQTEVVFNGIMRDKRKALKYRHKNEVDKIDMSHGLGVAGSRSAFDIAFDGLFYEAVKAGLRNTKSNSALSDYIKDGVLMLFSDMPDLDKVIADKIKRKYHNIGVRKKRFRRKAYLNKWNYFVTFTYDDKKHDEETFRRKLRKCLSNLHTRRDWKYMGVFERAPETGRLHFHGLLYVPDGEMRGEINELKDYSTAQHRMQTRHENTYFAKNFGRNDFEELS